MREELEASLSARDVDKRREENFSQAIESLWKEFSEKLKEVDKGFDALLLKLGKATSIANPQHVMRLRKILALLETAETLEDMDLPGLGLHPLKGNRKGIWAVKVSEN